MTHGRVRGRTALLALAAAFLGTASHLLAQVGALDDDISRVLSARKLGMARVGISVVDLDSGAALAAVNANEPFTPASNMKLLTSGAALMVLGPDFSFRTELIREGDRLIVRGAGDPALADPVVLKEMEPKLTVSDVLTALCGAVTKSGVSTVKEIVIDDRVFDREYVPATWPVEHLERGYCAEVCGLNFHANVLWFFTSPNAQGPGTPPSFSIEPEAPWMRVDVRARTVAERKNNAYITREGAANQFILLGDVGFQTQAPIEATLHNPAEFFGRALEAQLKKSGVQVVSAAGQDSAVRLAGQAEVLSGGSTIAVVRTPINEVLHRCNADSENLYAECLMKRMGNAVTKEPGSWGNGTSVLRMTITQRLGADHAAATTIIDGSGLSRGNLVTPATFTRWLGEINKDAKVRDTFTESLATPGVGTLKKRFNGAKLQNQVRGKSGFINGVRCLSGYVISATGHRVAYSVMVNDITSDDQTREALELHEDVVKIADRWLGQRVAAEVPKVGG